LTPWLPVFEELERHSARARAVLAKKPDAQYRQRDHLAWKHFRTGYPAPAA